MGQCRRRSWGLNPYDYDFEGAYYGQLQENNKSIASTGHQLQGRQRDSSRSCLKQQPWRAGSGENAGGQRGGALHPQDLKTKLESDWIGQRRRQNGPGYGDGGGEAPGRREGTRGREARPLP